LKRDISEARDPDVRNSLAAMKRAATIARKIAIDTNTGIVVVRDGKIVHISAKQLREGVE
jgi:imidazolonepropionase-like amidohydrolase